LAQKKVRQQPLAVRKTWINVHEQLPLTRQCNLAGVARSTVYAPPRAATHDAFTLVLLAAIDAEYTRHPFFGSLRMVVFLVQLEKTRGGKAPHLTFHHSDGASSPVKREEALSIV
jgi:hypothetical protein